jgi:hypothetical protein
VTQHHPPAAADDDDAADMPKKAGSSSGKSKSKKDAKGSLAPLLGSKHNRKLLGRPSAKQHASNCWAGCPQL